MKTITTILVGSTLVGVMTLTAFHTQKARPSSALRPYPKGCVFRTLMGEESSNGFAQFMTPDDLNSSMKHALAWMTDAQNPDGGWGAGSHSRQDIRDPHAVESDPATTAMVAMALLRTGSTDRARLDAAVEYLLQAVERSPRESLNVTQQVGTQIQAKLGQNIDVILTSQLFSNMMERMDESPMKVRIRNANATCIAKIQRAQSSDGSIVGSGWAGVLQSSFATNSLESAKAAGVSVSEDALAKGKAFQKNNFDAKTGAVNTEKGAGVVLYAVSGSSRAAAKEARRVREELEQAKKSGKLAPNAAPTVANLRQLGYSEAEALEYATSYEVYQSANTQAQRDDVMSGFGNNGGEEFLSYLQTGEGMVIADDTQWTKWYENVSGRLLKIQNDDGSWSGHHCITSPVFCTATCLLILSVHNDVDRLMAKGAR